MVFFFFFSSRRRHTRLQGDWSSDVCSSDLSSCVAQTADVRPIERLQDEAVRTRANQRVVVFQGLEVRPAERAQRVVVRVRLSFEDKQAEAEEQGTDTVRNRVEAAARAAAGCLDDLLPDN